MRRTHTLLALALIAAGAAVPAAARQLSVEEALQAARPDMPARIKGDSRVTLDYTATSGPLNTLYVVSFGQGYAVLAADDVAVPLLGYADSGSFDAAAIPPAMKAWLDEYSAQIAAAAAEGGSVSAAAPEAARSSIAPIVKTKWNQDAPYNNLCPTVDGRATYTGCVATALSQVMRVHQWPAKGRGSNSYTWTYYNTSGNKLSQTLSYDFSQDTFDWSNMTDTYTAASTDAQKTAVATLMSAAGRCVEMGYGLSSSGAVTRNAVQGLVEYFDYDKGLLSYPRTLFTLDRWTDMLYTELAEGRPVLYSGQNADNSGGHAFVVDGYSAADGFFHVNWGWGGMSDGYFLITTLDPGQQGIGGSASGYSNDQAAIMGIRRPVEGSDYAVLFGVTGTFSSVLTEYDRNSSVLVSVNGPFQNISAVTHKVRIGLRLVNDNSGETTDVWWIYSPSELKPYYYFSNAAFNSSAFPQEGTFTATPILETGGKVYNMAVSVSSPQALKIVATPSTLTFAAATPDSELSATAPVSAAGLYTRRRARITTSVSNSGSEYFAPVELRFMKGATQAATVPSGSIDLADGQSTEVTFDITLPAALTAGTYTMGIYDKAGRLVSPVAEAVVAAAPSGNTSYSFSDVSFVDQLSGNGTQASPAVIRARAFKMQATVNCIEGLFDTDVVAYIFPAAGGSSLTGISQSVLPIAAGESRQVTFAANISDVVEPGNTYIAMLSHRGTSSVSGTRYYFTVARPTGIDDVVADGGAAAPVLLSPNPAADNVCVSATAGILAVRVFSLAGSQMAESSFSGSDTSVTLSVADLAPGVYIVAVHTAGGTLTGRLVKR